VFVASYTAIIDRALFARSEPSEVDAAAVEKVMALVRNLVEVKREKHGEI
jgi:anti-sigma factor ChrR (cupin superfamily)